MSQNAYATAVRLKPLSTYQQASLYAGMHAIALFSLALPLTLPGWVIFLIVSAILVNLFWVLLFPFTLSTIEYRPNTNTWLGTITTQSNDAQPLVLTQGFIRPWFAILTLQVNATKQRCFLILPDKNNRASLHALYVLYSKRLWETFQG